MNTEEKFKEATERFGLATKHQQMLVNECYQIHLSEVEAFDVWKIQNDYFERVIDKENIIYFKLGLREKFTFTQLYSLFKNSK